MSCRARGTGRSTGWRFGGRQNRRRAEVTRDEMLGELNGFVGRELLGGRDDGLNEHTPLLAWGIIDSLSEAELVSFTSERFEIESIVHS